MTTPYFIRDIEISPGLVLAPMSGVTTSAFRRLVKRCSSGAVGLVMSEFISVEGLTREARRSLEMMRFREEERPFAIQIFGYDVYRMTEAAKMVEGAGADIVDINCGCPAPKVVRRGGGCELMRQPDHLRKIIQGVRAAVKMPLTMKVRSGWDEKSVNALEVAKMAEEEGVEAIAVHGRTRAQLYRGEADWEIVREIAQTLTIPVLGSGDVIDYASASSRFSGGVSGLYIGRGAISNPFIFTDIVEKREGVRKFDDESFVKILLTYIQFLLEDFPPQGCVGKVKQLSSQIGRGIPYAKDICRVSTLDEQLALLHRIGRVSEVSVETAKPLC